jgi:hypothetical protein
MGAKEGRRRKGAACPRQEDRPEESSQQKGDGKSSAHKGGEEECGEKAGHDYCTGCRVTCG